MPDQFPEPEVFRPERFDPEQGDTIPPYAYIPFAVGPRSCIGAPFATMEIKTGLAIVLQRFRLDLVAANRAQLEASGVPAAGIHVHGACTFESAHLPSHRRRPDGARFYCLVALR